MDPKTRLGELTTEEFCCVVLHVFKVKENDPVILRMFLIEAALRLASADVRASRDR